MFRNRYISRTTLHILQDMLPLSNFLNPVAEKGGQACNKCQERSQDSKNLLGERDLSPSAPTHFSPFSTHSPQRIFFRCLTGLPYFAHKESDFKKRQKLTFIRMQYLQGNK